MTNTNFHGNILNCIGAKTRDQKIEYKLHGKEETVYSPLILKMKALGLPNKFIFSGQRLRANATCPAADWTLQDSAAQLRIGLCGMLLPLSSTWRPPARQAKQLPQGHTYSAAAPQRPGELLADPPGGSGWTARPAGEPLPRRRLGGPICSGAALSRPAGGPGRAGYSASACRQRRPKCVPKHRRFTAGEVHEAVNLKPVHKLELS